MNSLAAPPSAASSAHLPAASSGADRRARRSHSRRCPRHQDLHLGARRWRKAASLCAGRSHRSASSQRASPAIFAGRAEFRSGQLCRRREDATPQVAAARATSSRRCASAIRSRSARHAIIFRWSKMPSTWCSLPAASASRRSGAWRNSLLALQATMDALLFRAGRARTWPSSKMLKTLDPQSVHLHFDDEADGQVS